MNLLITGASGQLGQNLTPIISPLFSHVYELSRHDAPSFDGFSLIKADLGSKDLEKDIDAIIQDDNIDLVLHMAAFVNSDADIDDWDLHFRYNVTGTHRLLNWSTKKKVGAFYFVSSYIHLNFDGQPFTIQALFSPTTPYGAAKLVNELEIAGVCMRSKIPYAIFRLSSFYGPNPTQVWTVLPIMIRSALLKGSIEIYGKGSRTMNFIHTNDIASAIAKAFGKRAAGIFHLASNRSVSMLELGKFIKGYLPETKIEIDRRPDPQEGKRFEVDISDTIRQLDWEPLTDISQGVSDAILSVRRALSIE